MKRFFYVIVVFLSFFLTFCKRQNIIFSESFLFANNNWQRFKTVGFPVTIKDTACNYKINLELNFQNDFPENNLFVYFYLIYPNGEKRYIETRLNVRDEKKSLLGIKTAEGNCIKTFIINSIHLSAPGIYKTEIGNLMTKYDNPGIQSVRLNIEKAE